MPSAALGIPPSTFIGSGLIPWCDSNDSENHAMWIDKMVLMIHSTSWMAYSELPDLIELVPFSTLVVPHNLMEGICLLPVLSWTEAPAKSELVRI